MDIQNCPSFSGHIGVGRCDITPPMGIYSRCWGAAEHDIAEGIHRPFCMTVLALRQALDASPLILAAMDASWFVDAGNEQYIRQNTLDALNLDESRLILNLSHSHACASLCACHEKKPGGVLIESYVQQVADALLDASREAIDSARSAVISFEETICPMIGNRDLPDPQDENRIVCGWNPDAQADQTVLVGRVTDNDNGKVIATLVNVACHPTTLAWENHLMSPDFVGAMRQIIEDHTDQAPCLFLQGVSGELAPKEQYTGDVQVADRHGRCLGYSVLSALEAMPPHGCALTYQGVVESGAPLGVWRSKSYAASTDIDASMINIELPLCQPDQPAQDKQQPASRWQDERQLRAQQVTQKVGAGQTTSMPAWIWRVGDALFVGQPNEPYSDFQQAMRLRFPDLKIVMMNLCNADRGVGYICPPQAYDGPQLYQVWQSPFGRQALHCLIDGCAKEIQRLNDSIVHS